MATLDVVGEVRRRVRRITHVNQIGTQPADDPPGRTGDIMPDKDQLTYLRHRASQERRLAQDARSRAAAMVHATLAAEYDRRAAALNTPLRLIARA